MADWREVAASIDGWLDRVLDAPPPAGEGRGHGDTLTPPLRVPEQAA